MKTGAHGALTLPQLYRRRRGQPRITAVTVEEVRADVRNSPLWPWVWIALLLEGQPVETAAAIYAATRSATAERSPQC